MKKIYFVNDIYILTLKFIKKIKPCVFTQGLFFCVGIYLFSQAAARQVSSAQVSLTSVFGMGTGGPSPQSTPT